MNLNYELGIVNFKARTWKRELYELEIIDLTVWTLILRLEYYSRLNVISTTQLSFAASNLISNSKQIDFLEA